MRLLPLPFLDLSNPLLVGRMPLPLRVPCKPLLQSIGASSNSTSSAAILNTFVNSLPGGSNTTSAAQFGSLIQQIVGQNSAVNSSSQLANSVTALSAYVQSLIGASSPNSNALVQGLQVLQLEPTLMVTTGNWVQLPKDGTLTMLLWASRQLARCRPTLS